MIVHQFGINWNISKVAGARNSGHIEQVCYACDRSTILLRIWLLIKSGVSWPSGLVRWTQVLALSECGFASRLGRSCVSIANAMHNATPVTALRSCHTFPPRGLEPSFGHSSESAVVHPRTVGEPRPNSHRDWPAQSLAVVCIVLSTPNHNRCSPHTIIA